MPDDDLDDHPFFADPPDDDGQWCEKAAEDAVAAWRWLAGVTAITGLIVALCVLLIVAVPAHADTGSACAGGGSGLPWWLVVGVVAAAALGVVAGFACIAGTATRRMEDRDR